MPWKALYFILLLRVTDAGVLMIFFLLFAKVTICIFFPKEMTFVLVLELQYEYDAW